MGMEGEQAGLGKRLRRAREDKGLSRADLSEELRLTQEKIRALEEEDFENLPECAFVRGYLRNYAAVVGISSDSLLAEYERSQVQAQGQGQPEGEGRSERGKLVPEPERPIIEHPWRVVWVSLVLLLLVTVVTLWLVGETREPVLSGAQSPGAGAPTAEDSRTGTLASSNGPGDGGQPAASSPGQQLAAPSEQADEGSGGPEGASGGPALALEDPPPTGEGSRRVTGGDTAETVEPEAGAQGRSIPDPSAQMGGEGAPSGPAPDEPPALALQEDRGGSPAPEPGQPSPAQEPEASGSPDSETASGSPSSVLPGPSLDSDPLTRDRGEDDGEAAVSEDTSQPALPEDLQALRIKTWAKSWMEVADARDRLLLRRLVPADQDLRLYGQPPFEIKVGNAAGVQLYFQGKPLVPLGDSGQVVEITVDKGSETVPESEVAPPPNLGNGTEG